MANLSKNSLILEWVVCHYGEIALKGKNRKFFEEKLIQNIKRQLSPSDFDFVKRISGRIIIKLSTRGIARQKPIAGALKKVFGLVNFAFALNSEQGIEEIKAAALRMLENKKFKTFRISSQRADKSFPFTSQRINEEAGAEVCLKLKKKVDLGNPEITCFIEIAEKYCFVYAKKIKGAGGLPVGTSGKIMVLLSGGIDSPVAAFYAMKRGVEPIFVHFHAYPYTDKASVEKVEKIVKVLNRFQPGLKLYSVPFADIQKEILLKTPAKLRVVLYRRFMLRIAARLAEKENACALLTGESIGQVASQTIENMKAIEAAVDIPVFRPLLGFDKEEIIKKARQIGTYEISILPHHDCCSRFLPLYPATRAGLTETEKAEKALDADKLVRSAIKNASILDIR